MKKIIALHGNPGTVLDFNFLADQATKAGYEFEAVSSFDPQWVLKVNSDHGKYTDIVLLGHSWGCYQILKNVDKINSPINQIVLINPYVVAENPLSTVASIVINTPLLGDLLLKKSFDKSIDEFVANELGADGPPGSELYVRVRKQLDSPKLWAQAARNKVRMQNEPFSELSPKSAEKVKVIFGTEDRVSTESVQIAVLKSLGIKNFEFLKGGHGLIWSQAEEIIRMINQNSNPNQKKNIGYHSGSNIQNNVISYLESHLKEHPNKIALRWADTQGLKNWVGSGGQGQIQHNEISYAGLAQRINSFARGLLDIGISKGDRVIIFLPMSLDMYVAMFAVQRIGAIAVFLDSWARSHHLGASAECVEPKAMISFDMAFKLVNQVPEFNSMPIRVLYGPGEGCTHKFEELLKSEAAPITAVEMEDTALITFTTGSTGKPKGANRTHRFLAAQHNALTHVIPYNELDIDMPAFPIFSLNNLATGVTTVLPAVNLAAPAEYDSALLTHQILNQKITCTTLSPSMLIGVARFCKENGIILSGLRRVVTGGAPISKDDVSLFYSIAPQTDIWVLYGSTEAEPMAHIEGRDMLKDIHSQDSEVIEEGVNVGHISEDIDYRFVKIVDGPIELGSAGWKDIEVKTGAIGEFICTGDHVCTEYYNNKEAFYKTKIVGEDGRVWHRTGDMGYIDSDKNLWLVGRTNNAIVRNGQYFFPVRAEVILKRMDFTARCAFLGLPDSKLGEKTIAAIELKEGTNLKTFDFAAARLEISRVFNKNQLPLDEIIFVSKVPMDPRHHSKVEYAVLRKQLLEGEQSLG